jgi:hypothetical protein
MSLQADEFDPGKGVIHEGTVLVSELGTAHRTRGTGDGEISSPNNTAILPKPLFQPWPDYLGKAVPRPIETRLYRTEVGVSNLRNLLIRLPF